MKRGVLIVVLGLAVALHAREQQRLENWPAEVARRAFELKKRPFRESWRAILRGSVTLDEDRNPRVVDGLHILAERLRARRAV